MFTSLWMYELCLNIEHHMYLNIHNLLFLHLNGWTLSHSREWKDVSKLLTRTVFLDFPFQFWMCTYLLDSSCYYMFWFINSWVFGTYCKINWSVCVCFFFSKVYTNLLRYNLDNNKADIMFLIINYLTEVVKERKHKISSMFSKIEALFNKLKHS